MDVLEFLGEVSAVDLQAVPEVAVVVKVLEVEKRIKGNTIQADNMAPYQNQKSSSILSEH